MKIQNWLAPSKRVLSSVAVAAALSASTVAFADVSLGPSGGAGGGSFYDSVPAWPTGISYIYVRSGTAVDSIQTVWSNGQFSGQHGGNGGGFNFYAVPLFQNIHYVWGYSGNYVDSIAFCTNTWACSPRWGGNGGAFFSYEAPPLTSIVGFKGRSGALLDAVGVIVR